IVAWPSSDGSTFRTIATVPDPKLAEHLRRYPLFAKLPDAELLQLAERTRIRSFKRGEMLFRKDDPGTHLYLVLAGAVKIALPSEFGQEALVAIIGASRVSVNRVLGDLERREIIEIRRRHIVVKDPAKLAKEIRP